MDRAYWLAWSQVPGIGPILLKRLHQEFRSLCTAWTANSKQLSQVEGLGEVSIEKIINARSGVHPVNNLETHSQKNPNFWTPADPDYPKLLWEIADPPPLLYWTGNLQTWDESKAIAMVGTREPTIYGRRWARKIGKALAENGYTVVSGLADGIDAEAHLGCLEANGQAIAVVGTGVDRVYPTKNQAIYQKIQRNGLVISEYPQGTPPDRGHFPQRNRIIAGLCRATILIEAPMRSGALITVYQANDYGRDVFALPGSLDFEQSRGCLSVIQRGAQIILGIAELLEALGTIPTLDSATSKPLIPAPTISQKQKPPSNTTKLAKTTQPDLLPADPMQQQILALLNHQEIVGFDRLVEELNLPPGEISGALLQLELLGMILQHPGMRYQRHT
jgi:DNA processing protein